MSKYIKLDNADDSLLTEDSEACKEQKSKLEPVAKNATPTEDCISRQGVIDAIEGTDWYHINENGEMVSGSTSEHESWYKHDDIMLILETIPSPPVEPKPVQPEGVIPHRNYKYLSDYWCECGWHLGEKGVVKYCAKCGRKVNWDE